MSTKDDETLINEAVTELVGGDKVFTQFSVYKKVRDNGSKTSYNDLKTKIWPVVKHYVDAGLYGAKANIDVGGGQKAWVYHPSTYDMSTFDAKDLA